MKRIILPLALALMTSAAHAAPCTPSVDTSTGAVAIDISSCSGVQVTGLPGGAGIVVTDSTGNITSDGGGALAAQTVQNTTDIADTKGRLDTFVPSVIAPAGSLESWAGGVDTHLAAVDTHLASLDATVAAQSGQIKGLTNRVDKVESGLALAAALQTPIFQPGQKFAINAGWGEFRGNNAMSLSAAGVVWSQGTRSATLYGGMAYDPNASTSMAKGGVSLGW